MIDILKKQLATRSRPRVENFGWPITNAFAAEMLAYERAYLGARAPNSEQVLEILIRSWMSLLAELESISSTASTNRAGRSLRRSEHCEGLAIQRDTLHSCSRTTGMNRSDKMELHRRRYGY